MAMVEVSAMGGTEDNQNFVAEVLAAISVLEYEPLFERGV